MNNKIKFIIVGCGMIGKKHINMIQENPGCEILAIIDNKKNNEIDDSLNDLKFFKSLNQFFKSDLKADVATIATPNNLHVEHSLECLENNLHVVVEKPLALKKTDAEKIIKKSNEMKKHVFVVMQNRYSFPIKWAKNILEKNLIGNVYIVQINCFWNRDDRYYKDHEWHGKKNLDGGTLFTQFSHFIDIIYFLFGEVKIMNSNLFNFSHKKTIEFEDSGIINFQLLKGQGGSISLNYTTSVWDKNLESSMTVIGEKGSFKLGGQYMDNIEYCHIQNYDLPKNSQFLKQNDKNIVSSNKNHKYVIQNVVDVINKSKKINANAIEGLKVTEIIEKIYSTSKKND